MQKYNIHKKLSMDTIELIFDIFVQICSSNKNKFWKNINILLNEKTKYQTLTNFKEQFDSTAVLRIAIQKSY